MKKKIFLIFTTLLFIISCNQGLKPSLSNSDTQVDTKIFGKISNMYIPEEKYPNPEFIKESFSIVKVSDDFDLNLINRLGGEIKAVLNFNDGYKYLSVYCEEEKSLRYALNNTPSVVYAEPDYEQKLDYTVSHKVGKVAAKSLAYTKSSKLSDQGVMNLDDGNLEGDPAGDNYEYALRITHALESYADSTNAGYGDKEAVIAIIDTGINMNHEDFKDGAGNSVVLYAKSAFKHDILNNNFEALNNTFRVLDIPSNEDGGGHGTHCSGTMCARGNNKKGMNGVAWKNTKLISYKGLSNSGRGSNFAIYGGLGDLTKIVSILKKKPSTRTSEEKSYISNLPVEAQNYQITQATVPVNMSLGGGSGGSFALEMLNKAISVGILPVVAMGNEGRTISSYPAGYQGVLAVGATTAMDIKADFSNSGSWISVSAPGHNIISCTNGDWSGGAPVKDTTGITYMNGTSMATPFVTGLLGYLLSFDGARNLTPYQLKRVLELSADKINKDNKYFPYDKDVTDPDAFSKWYGYGRVNVYKAAKMVKSGTGIPSAGSVYSEKTMKFTVQNKNAGKFIKLGNQKIYLYEKNTNRCVAVGMTDKNGEVKFNGLKVGTKYVAKINVYDEPKNYDFTADNTDAEHTFNYKKTILFVSTVKNKYYNNGNDKTDTIIEIYEADASGNIDIATAKPVHKYDYYFLDTTSFEYKPETKYYVLIKAYNHRGGNYGFRVDIDALNTKNGINLADKPARTAKDNDSHEDDNTPTEAKAKGNVWGKTIAGNLLISGKDDVDWFYIETPKND